MIGSKFDFSLLEFLLKKEAFRFYKSKNIHLEEVLKNNVESYIEEYEGWSNNENDRVSLRRKVKKNLWCRNYEGFSQTDCNALSQYLPTTCQVISWEHFVGVHSSHVGRFADMVDLINERYRVPEEEAVISFAAILANTYALKPDFDAYDVLAAADFKKWYYQAMAKITEKSNIAEAKRIHELMMKHPVSNKLIKTLAIYIPSTLVSCSLSNSGDGHLFEVALALAAVVTLSSKHDDEPLRFTWSDLTYDEKIVFQLFGYSKCGTTFQEKKIDNSGKFLLSQLISMAKISLPKHRPYMPIFERYVRSFGRVRYRISLTLN